MFFSLQLWLKKKKAISLSTAWDEVIGGDVREVWWPVLLAQRSRQLHSATVMFGPNPAELLFQTSLSEQSRTAEVELFKVRERRSPWWLCHQTVMKKETDELISSGFMVTQLFYQWQMWDHSAPRMRLPPAAAAIFLGNDVMCVLRPAGGTHSACVHALNWSVCSLTSAQHVVMSESLSGSRPEVNDSRSRVIHLSVSSVNFTNIMCFTKVEATQSKLYIQNHWHASEMYFSISSREKSLVTLVKLNS